MRFLLLGMLAACTTPTPAPASEPEPVPPPPAPWLASVHGSFYTRTDLSVALDSPDTTLLAYSSAPGTTLIAAAEDAHLPALALLPDEASLASWYDAALRANGIGLFTAYSAAKRLQLMPAQAIIESELVIDGPSVHHELTAIYFDVTNISDRYVLAGGVDTTATYTPDTSGGEMKLAAHDLAIDLGDLSYQNDDPATIRQLVGEATSCPAIAIAVAEKCGGCTLQIPAFDDLCEQGLDQIFAETRAELGTVKLHLTGGSAVLIDQDGDQSADRLEGAWLTPGDPVEFHARKHQTP